MTHDIGMVARTVMSGLVMAAVSCGGIQGREVQQPIDHSPEPSLAECLIGKKLAIVPDDVSDPHGQGQDLLGFGFLEGEAIDSNVKDTFIRVDQLDLQTMRTAQGKPIHDAKVVSRHFAADSGAPAESLWNGATVQGKLHCSDPRFAGKTITVTVRIDQAARPTAENSSSGAGLWGDFELALELPDGPKIANACRDTNDTAFPISGYWNDDGSYVRSDRWFSFACTRRDVATCLKQRYREDGPPEKLSLFEACTRMMRADYCGDGVSYTNDGTFISIWDNREVSDKQEATPMVFEAAWGEHGAVCLSRPRWGTKKPKCTPNACRSADEAMSLFPNTALMFDDSCEQHPCTITHVEPFSAEQDGDRTTAVPKTSGVTASQ